MKRDEFAHGWQLRHLCAMLTALAVLLLPFSAWGETLEAYARDRFRERRITGGGVVIARDGEVLFSYAYGYRDGLKSNRATLDTCYQAASVTKLVSAIGLLQLLEDYDIPLDTPVKEIVGFPVVNPAFPEVDITIRQVLSHTSSFVQNQHLIPSWETLPAENSYFSAKAAPGTAYVYSNMNGGLIGAMIEAISGQSVNTYMQAHVFAPLEINAAYHPALLPDQTDISSKLRKDGTSYCSAAKSVRSIDAYHDACDPRANTNITSGSLWISPNGLARIGMLLENGGALDGVRILTEETVAMMMADQHTIAGSSVAAPSPYGLCLNRIEGMPGGTWYGHQGVWQGLTSNVYFQPDTGLCVAVIANGYRANKKDGVATIARAFMEKAQEFTGLAGE